MCTPCDARNVAMSSWVVSGLPPQQATSAPRPFRPISRTEVSFVMCRHSPTVTPRRGLPLPLFLRRDIVLSSIFMCDLAHSYEVLP